MSISQLTSEQLQEMAMIEIAYLLLEEEKQAIEFYELFNKIAELKGFTEEQKEDRIAQFYTDLNVDGRYLCIGENRWGIRHWYPYDQVDEEVTLPAKPKKKKTKKKSKVVEDDFDDYDEEVDEDDEFADEDEDVIDDIDDDEEEEDFIDEDEELDEEEIELDDEDLIEEDDFELDEELDDSEKDEEEEEEEDLFEEEDED